MCPQPPLLVPELARGVDKAAQRLRDTDAIRRLTWSATSRIAVVTGAKTSGRWRSDAGASLAPYGVDVRAGGPVPELPLSLTLGAWLLGQAGWNEARVRRRGSDATAADAMAVGAQLVSEDESLGLLELGDGSAKRATTSPGYRNDRAEACDASVAAALSAADVEALIGLDATMRMSSGRPGVPRGRCWRALVERTCGIPKTSVAASSTTRNPSGSATS